MPIGHIRRLESPRQLMGYLGLVPEERSTGETVRRGSTTGPIGFRGSDIRVLSAR